LVVFSVGSTAIGEGEGVLPGEIIRAIAASQTANVQAAAGHASLKEFEDVCNFLLRAVFNYDPAICSFPRFANFVENTLGESFFPPAASAVLAYESC
jgi:hypothetical protein